MRKKAAGNSATKRMLIPLGGLLVLLCLLVGLQFLGFFRDLNNYYYDLFLRLHGTRSTSQHIVVIAVDEKTLGKLGRWPIDRSNYARLIEALPQSCVVGFDIILSEKAAGDEALARAIHKHGRVILPIYVNRNLEVIEPVVSLPGAVGHIHVEPGIDGVLRQVYLTLRVGEVHYPSLASAVAKAFAGRSDAQPAGGDPAGNRPERTCRLQQDDPLRIHYYGPPGSYPQVSLVDVLDGSFPPSYFENKIALVGVVAPGIEDTILTPFSQFHNRSPGVEIHANVINNLLDGSDLKSPAPVPAWLLPLIFITLVYAAFFHLGVWAQALLWFGSVTAPALISYSLMGAADIWFAPALSQAGVSAAYGLAYVFRLRLLKQHYFEAKTDWEETFHSIQDAILIENRDGRIVRCNGSAQALLDHACWDEIRFKLAEHASAAARIDPDGPEVLPEGNRDLASHRLTLAEPERHFDCWSWPRYDLKSKIDGTVHLIRDVTKEILAERQRQELERQLIQSQKMESIGTLASGIAHDFNNLIGAISGNAELLLNQGGHDRSTKRRISRVLDAASRAKQLAGQILSFSRSSEQEESQEPTELNRVVTETIDLLRSTLPANIRIEHRIDCNGLVPVPEVSLQQILINLATNSYHAMRETGGTLTCKVLDPVAVGFDKIPEIRSASEQYVLLEVGDTGHGIPESVRSRIFEPYFTTKARGMGTGLGLSIVCGIVERHHGVIDVASRPDEGTTFRILLPCTELRQLPAEQENEPVISEGPVTVMVLDDQPEMLDIVRELLETMGYRAVTATSAADAVAFLDRGETTVDVVICDINVNDMRGDQVAGMLKQKHPDLPVVLCAGHVDPALEDRARASGVSTFLRKPFTTVQLTRAIRDSVEKSVGERGPSAPHDSAESSA